MDLLEKTKEICKEHNIKPVRSRGQNFLIKENVYDKIIESADLKKDETVLEVGPGLGFLTEKLAGKVKKVIAVELDDKLVEVLKNKLKSDNIKNVEVVNENILEIFNFQFSIFNFQLSKYKIVANLPYNITSVFLRKILSSEVKPKLMVLMLQKEVAERITAKPGKMSLLAVSVQFYADVQIIDYVPANNFWPEPEVNSAIIKLTVGTSFKPVRTLINEKEFFRLVKIGFSAKRKILKNNLANGFHISQDEAGDILKKAGFDLKIRAQELSVKDWIRLLKYF
ncbi:MAG: 16S rRNA (adenine(1518)-N(6)/adenine(1519)-N(6))-dimethyltransferase RsmA [Candidatus Falkowbacteria bacterium]